MARILPVFISSLIIGIILWKFTFNRYATNALTATDAFTPIAVAMRVIGINTFVPWRYQQTFLGNAALCTVIVEIYIYFFYPIIYKLDERCCIKWKVCFFLLWGGILLISEQTGNRNWWENMCVFNFIPLWYIGALFNNREICEGKKWIVYSSFMGLIYCLLYIPFRITEESFILVWISEIRKLIFAFMMALMIRYVDDYGEKISFMTFGLLDIGTISYSIYAVHGPVIIWMLGAEIDIITLLIGLLVLSILEYYIFEKYMSEYIMRRLKIINIKDRKSRIYC